MGRTSIRPPVPRVGNPITAKVPVLDLPQICVVLRSPGGPPLSRQGGFARIAAVKPQGGGAHAPGRSEQLYRNLFSRVQSELYRDQRRLCYDRLAANPDGC